VNAGLIDVVLLFVVANMIILGSRTEDIGSIYKKPLKKEDVNR